MEYNTKNPWVWGLCPSSGILNNSETERFGNWISSSLPCDGKVTATPEIEVSSFWRTQQSRCPPHFRSRYRNVGFSSYLEFWMMGKPIHQRILRKDDSSEATSQSRLSAKRRPWCHLALCAGLDHIWNFCNLVKTEFEMNAEEQWVQNIVDYKSMN
jgi:hypothetical protein